MSFICVRMKNDFHIKGWAITLVLKQRRWGTRKWPAPKKKQQQPKKTSWSLDSLRKQPTFRDATKGFPAKWLLGNERRNSVPLTCHYPDLISVSDWLKQISISAQPIRSTTQIWIVTRHQYGISALVPQTLFRGETSACVAKCQLFSQASFLTVIV